jgi:hypothetical protein
VLLSVVKFPNEDQWSILPMLENLGEGECGFIGDPQETPGGVEKA